MKKIIFIFFTLSFLLSLSLFSCSETEVKEAKDPVDYVDPYIGNISHLLVPTFPTIHMPNAMLRVYPERTDFTSDLISGLPVAVTSHRGSSAFNLSPTQNPKEKLPRVISYSYDLEKITPYRYSVFLDNENISVQYAPTDRSAIYNFQFGKDADSKLVVNTGNGVLTEKDGAISGFQIIDNTQTKIYLYLEADAKTKQVQFLKDDILLESSDDANTIILNWGKEKSVNVRYGISFISAEQAKENLEKEQSGFDLELIAKAGRSKWNETLSKIEVTSGSDNEKTIFYTSLYRTYERMINISEGDRYYSSFDNQIHEDQTPFYTDDWIWDTYRATHPLRILIEPEIELDMIKSYIRMAQQSPNGWMPTFPEITGDSHRMNGNHAVAVIWDAYIKGLTGFDLEAAYEACKGAITEKTLLPWKKVPQTELDIFYHKNGFYPALHPNETETCKDVDSFERRQAISVMLGDSYDNWCLAQIAKQLKKKDDYNLFMKRSYFYRNVYNAETGFFHPKDIKGEFIQPFDYKFDGGQGARAYYGENNGWIYRWDVQHNVADLISLMGGRQQFIDNLNQTFREPLGRGKHDFYAKMPDHTGNVGQFSMANEPSLHIPYLYNYVGQPWMTQKRIRTLLDQWFRNDLMGIPGDEDGGGMTAFVVFSQLGFYPVTPGSPTYNIGSPVFETAKLNLGNNKYFEIVAENYSLNNKYIQSATLNGEVWDKPWFSHEDIKNGAKLVLVMGDKANKEWGAKPGATPPSAEKLID